MSRAEFITNSVFRRCHLIGTTMCSSTNSFLFQRTFFTPSILTMNGANLNAKFNSILCIHFNPVLRKTAALGLINNSVIANSGSVSRYSHKVSNKDGVQNSYKSLSSKPNNSVKSDLPVSSTNLHDHPSMLIEIPKKPTSQEIPSPFKRYFLGRYSKYLERFQKALANEMPDTFHMFSTFSRGFKDFVIDFRDYIVVLIKLSIPSNKLKNLNRRELEVWYNMPSQMIKVSPVVILSSFPFAQNVVLPIAYCLPRHLLCYHFWDDKQREDFGLLYLTKRLYNARPVFRSLQERLEEIKDPFLKQCCQSVFYSLGSGIHPSMQEILYLLELFNQEPFHINTLWSAHVNSLLRLHNLSAWFRRRKRLYDHARYIHYLDISLNKEGLSTLNSEQLRNMMILRGVNPTGISNMEAIDYLEMWIYISLKLTKSSYSLLLHLPIFLAYNQPNNLILLYR